MSVNANKLRGIRDEDRNECYGIVKDGVANIIRSVFSKVCAENGLSEKGLLSHLRARGLVQASGGVFTKAVRLSPNQVARCVCLVLPKEDPPADDEFSDDQIGVTDLPF